MRRLALMWGPAALVVVSVAAYVAGTALVPTFESIGLLYAGMLVAFGGTGVAVTRSQPANPIGWMFVGSGLAAGLAELSHGVADRTASPIVANYASASWIPLMLPAVTFLLLLFPDGRLRSRRWRWVAWCAAVSITAAFVSAFLRPGPIEDYPQIVNPYGWAGAEALEGVSWLLLLVGLVGGPVSLTRRFRGAPAAERQQIKWLALSGSLAALMLVAGIPALVLGAPEVAVYVPMMLGVLSLPVAAAVAIVRYRLYDIDVVVNRALVYTGLTATLVGAYLLTVLVAQFVLPERSDFGVALSTLAAVVAFAPARRRIQSAVDRRFFRRRYDAANTLSAFGTRLRDEVSLEAVAGELRIAAAETLQPAHVSVWMRP